MSSEWGISAASAALHRSAIVWDMTLPYRDLGPPEGRRKLLPRLVDSGYTFVSLTVASDADTLAATMHKIGRERAMFLAEPDRYLLVDTADDVVRAKEQGKLAVSFHFQGTNPLEFDTGMVEIYYRLGVRHMLIAYNMRNAAGDGCTERTDGGLSRYGMSVVKEMNRVGMMVDASHCGYRTSLDMIEVSTDPVVFSHSNARALCDHPRNITDDQIRACAQSGGVIGVDGIGLFLGNNDVSTEAFVRHIDYIAELVGPQHVGIGLDYIFDAGYALGAMTAGSGWLPPEALKDPQAWLDIPFVEPERLPSITEALVDRGYSEADIRGILGGNWLSVARRVWQ